MSGGIPPSTTAANEVYGPADTGEHAGTATTTTTTAANLTLQALDAPGAYYTFQPRGGDVYVRLKSSATTAATTSGDGSNGVKIVDGQKADFWISNQSRVCDHICSAATKTLFWWKSSRALGSRP